MMLWMDAGHRQRDDQPTTAIVRVNQELNPLRAVIGNRPSRFVPSIQD
jgi:hypothetical protein